MLLLLLPLPLLLVLPLLLLFDRLVWLLCRVKSHSVKPHMIACDPSPQDKNCARARHR